MHICILLIPKFVILDTLNTHILIQYRILQLPYIPHQIRRVQMKEGVGVPIIVALFLTRGGCLSFLEPLDLLNIVQRQGRPLQRFVITVPKHQSVTLQLSLEEPVPKLDFFVETVVEVSEFVLVSQSQSLEMA